MKKNPLPEDLADLAPRRRPLKSAVANAPAQLPQDFIDSIPPVLWRLDPDFPRIMGISRRRAANMDCSGEGPEERVLMGRNRVGYPKAAVIRFLERRLRLESRKSIPDEAA